MTLKESQDENTSYCSVRYPSLKKYFDDEHSDSQSDGRKALDQREFPDNRHGCVDDRFDTSSIENALPIATDNTANDLNHTLELDSDHDQAPFDISSNFEFSSTMEGWTGFEAPSKGTKHATEQDHSDQEQLVRIVAMARALAVSHVPRSAGAGVSTEIHNLIQAATKVVSVVQAAENDGQTDLRDDV
ncbi:hypothetical protein K4K49_003986 [Colletotrichum sp. SAR 10_70]|nr:hypothetical protein K4K50_003140 [Colletotrichum sp. SAR 10_71]KAI8171744.1 hypothetical protein K4K49_003986 [Colletotrichum sp. SAR 10_70]KAI8194019.1 hypothetical protein KHU50_012057 [Colletotrichum sp. SAR 10_65]KAI8251830.1 hypothetical protein K4K53_011817 [Colletotrichum sp. SAR 10_77]